jgi:hypothetical protein
MPLDATALISVPEFKMAFGGVAGTNKDDAIERAINAASAIVQDHLGRKLCDRSLTNPWTRTEYHSVYHYTSELWLVDWPIVSITSVSEDTARAYSTTLTVDQDFVIDKPNGRLLRVQSGGGAYPWMEGFEAIKVVGVLGYQDTDGKPTAAAPVPSDIKDATAWIACRLFQEAEQKRWDVQSATDPTGTVTRFSASRLPPMMQDRLASHRARPGTGRRAA